MRLFAHEEEGRVIVERVVKKGFRKPQAWLEITEEDLPPRHQRDAWCIVDGALTVDAAKAEACRLRAIRRKRAAEYPSIGDQLDALLKQLNYMRLNGQDMVQEMDDILASWLRVKQDNPLD
jgi:hypothetical protein